MKKMVKGEITAFLSLVFLLLLTLVGALLESASIQLAKNERRADAGRAVESAFAEYQKDLLERYGIFAIEGSYESGTMSEENILNRLSFYGAENIETEIAAIRYLTDQNGKEFLRQAVEYEKMKTGAAAIENLTGKVSEWKEQELKANEYGKENIETSKELDQMLESEKEELPAENNPLADIVDIQAHPIRLFQCFICIFRFVCVNRILSFFCFASKFLQYLCYCFKYFVHFVSTFPYKYCILQSVLSIPRLHQINLFSYTSSLEVYYQHYSVKSIM